MKRQLTDQEPKQELDNKGVKVKTEFFSMSDAEHIRKMNEQETVRRNLEALSTVWKALGVLGEKGLMNLVCKKIEEHLKLLNVN